MSVTTRRRLASGTRERHRLQSDAHRRRRDRRRARRRCRPAVRDHGGPVARRGAHGQRRPAAARRHLRVAAPRRRAAALLLAAARLDRGVRHERPRGAVAVGRVLGGDAAVRVLRRPAPRRAHRGLGRRPAAGVVAVRHPLRHRGAHVLAGHAAGGAGLPGADACAGAPVARPASRASPRSSPRSSTRSTGRSTWSRSSAWCCSGRRSRRPMPTTGGLRGGDRRLRRRRHHLPAVGAEHALPAGAHRDAVGRSGPAGRRVHDDARGLRRRRPHRELRQLLGVQPPLPPGRVRSVGREVALRARPAHPSRRRGRSPACSSARSSSAGWRRSSPTPRSRRATRRSASRCSCSSSRSASAASRTCPSGHSCSSWSSRSDWSAVCATCARTAPRAATSAGPSPPTPSAATSSCTAPTSSVRPRAVCSTTCPGSCRWCSRPATARSSSTGSTTRSGTAPLDAGAFATRALERAGPDHTVWYVSSLGYSGGNEGKCEAIAAVLQADRPDSTVLVAPNDSIFESMGLTRYRTRATAALKRWVTRDLRVAALPWALARRARRRDARPHPVRGRPPRRGGRARPAPPGDVRLGRRVLPRHRRARLRGVARGRAALLPAGAAARVRARDRAARPRRCRAADHHQRVRAGVRRPALPAGAARDRRRGARAAGGVVRRDPPAGGGARARVRRGDVHAARRSRCSCSCAPALRLGDPRRDARGADPSPRRAARDPDRDRGDPHLARRVHVGARSCAAARWWRRLVGAGIYLLWTERGVRGSWLPLRLQNSDRLRGGFVDPFTRIWDGVHDLFGGDRFGSGLHVLWIAVFVALLVVVCRRLPASYGAYAGAVLVVSMSARNLDSFERYAMSAFPLILGVAIVTEHRDVDRAVLTLSAAGLVGYSVLAFLGVWVPVGPGGSAIGRTRRYIAAYESAPRGSGRAAAQRRHHRRRTGRADRRLRARHRHGITSTVLEADTVVGGISRTVERDGWRFDIGGHRFFTKVKEVDGLWHEILARRGLPAAAADEPHLLRGQVLRLPAEGAATRCGTSASSRRSGACCRTSGRASARRRTSRTLEGWIVARFGWRLYGHFFKTYNEKLWGVPVNKLPADFAAQRIKNLSLFNAVDERAAARSATRRTITSLIEEFQYPKYGPGMMWERCRDLVEAQGCKVVDEQPRRRDPPRGRRARCRSIAEDADGARTEYPCDHVISSMPISQLLQAMDPPAADAVRGAADDLRYRDFLTVALVVPEEYCFPDNWIYIHSRDVQVGRIQNFGSWSPYLVKEGRTCLGLEFFVFEGDEMWTKPDEELVEQGKRELGTSDWSTRQGRGGLRRADAEGVSGLRRALQGQRAGIVEWIAGLRAERASRSAATACTGTTTRTTRCSPRCSRSRTSRRAPTTTCGR